jgi:diguanylate cyclase
MRPATAAFPMPKERTQSSVPGLANVVDEHLRWIGQWHRAAFFATGEKGAELAAPRAFQAWIKGARIDDLTAQPAVGRLSELHDQMHRMASVVLKRTSAGQPPSAQAYEAVIEKFDDFMAQLRRVERAFSVARGGIDPLTGLRTRSGLMDELAAEANRLVRTGQPFCVAICDLDRFKNINDTHGHDAGDRVLMAVAGAVNRGIRSFDEAFRLGGEEILILLKNASLVDGFVVLERLRCEIAATPIRLPDAAAIRVSASFGLVEATKGQDVLEILKRADDALYEAKRGGRNRVVRSGIDKGVVENAGIRTA